jgi:hypothetical protein
MMFFDAVLDKDMMPVFNDTPEKTKKFLETELLSLDHSVCVGKTMRLLTIPQYLEGRQ